MRNLKGHNMDDLNYDKENDMLRFVVLKKDRLALFAQHLKKEMCLENLLGFIEMQQFIEHIINDKYDMTNQNENENENENENQNNVNKNNKKIVFKNDNNNSNDCENAQQQNKKMEIKITQSKDTDINTTTTHEKDTENQTQHEKRDPNKTSQMIKNSKRLLNRWKLHKTIGDTEIIKTERNEYINISHSNLMLENKKSVELIYILLCEKYILPGTEFELNLSYNVRKQLLSIYDQCIMKTRTKIDNLNKHRLAVAKSGHFKQRTSVLKNSLASGGETIEDLLQNEHKSYNKNENNFKIKKEEIIPLLYHALCEIITLLHNSMDRFTGTNEFQLIQIEFDNKQKKIPK